MSGSVVKRFLFFFFQIVLLIAATYKGAILWFNLIGSINRSTRVFKQLTSLIRSRFCRELLVGEIRPNLSCVLSLGL